MTYQTDKPLDNPINWSFQVGRLFGINVRLHVMLVLAVFVMILLEIPREVGAPVSAICTIIDGLGTYLLLFIVVLLHEFGHCFGARYTGGEADEILLWPLGGLAMTRPPHNPSAHMITTLAGPLVNVIICAITSLILVQWTGKIGAVPWNPIHPLIPLDQSIYLTEGQDWLMRGFGVSYFLFLINLIPVFPFDGGRVVQAWLWPRRGYRESMAVSATVGMIAAVVIGVLAFFGSNSSVLVMIAVFGYVDCHRTRRAVLEESEFDIGGGEYDRYSDDEEGTRSRTRRGPVERSRARRAAAKAEREQARERELEQAVEDILAKVSRSGLSSLTPAERKILDEESRRQRTLRGE